MTHPVAAACWRLLITPYTPQVECRAFLARGQTQENTRARVTVAVLDAAEAASHFGVSLARRGIQPVFLRVENRSDKPQRLQLLRVDPNYYTPREAAGVCHFSIVRRLSAFGFLGWLFLPLLALVPFKLISAWRANRRMDEHFHAQAFRLRPIPPGEAAEGFVFTLLDAGTKIVHVCLQSTGQTLATTAAAAMTADPERESAEEFTFSIPVPGIAADYLRRDFAAIAAPGALEKCDLPALVGRLRGMPAATSNGRGTRAGDPVNLVVIGPFDTLLAAFASRWDESETVTPTTCWKTVRAFLLGSEYRYSPVSPLYLFGRSQDVALQRTRRSINERLHLRLWLTPLLFDSQPVWVGQVSRDIGVRLTVRTWSLTTHRIDPDVDEARDYVLEDLLHAERVEAAGYVDGVGACESSAPRGNLTGDTYFTDGKRAVVLLSANRAIPRFVAW